MVRVLFTLSIFISVGAWASHYSSGQSGLQGLWVGPHTFPVEGRLLKPFISDGCTIAMDGLSLNPVWKQCCVVHDVAYWLGGTAREKEKSDRELFRCVSKKGYPRVAEIYFKAVRKFGIPNRTPFRWGFGWNYVRGYGSLTAAERKQAEYWYGPGLQKIHEAIRAGKIKTVPYEESATTWSPLRPEEKRIYRYLQKKLKTDEIVKLAELGNFNLEMKEYRIFLSSCKRGGLVFIFSKRDPHGFRLKDYGHCLK